MNKKFRNKNRPRDILSFPSEEKLNIKKNFVGLHARDDYYVNKYHSEDKNFHTYRNFNESIIGIYQRMMPDLSWSHNIKSILEYANNYNIIVNHLCWSFTNLFI